MTWSTSSVACRRAKPPSSASRGSASRRPRPATPRAGACRSPSRRGWWRARSTSPRSKRRRAAPCANLRGASLGAAARSALSGALRSRTGVHDEKWKSKRAHRRCVRQSHPAAGRGGGADQIPRQRRALAQARCDHSARACGAGPWRRTRAEGAVGGATGVETGHQSCTSNVCAILASRCFLLLRHAMAAEGEKKAFSLPDKSKLELAIPAGWQDELKANQATKGQQGPAADTIVSPRNGALRGFVTPVARQKPGASADTAIRMRDSVQQARQGEASAASLFAGGTPHWRSGPVLLLCDHREPKPGEFKYLKQGMLWLATGGAFSISPTTRRRKWGSRRSRAEERLAIAPDSRPRP